jgi:hypothetical protein
MPVRPYSQIVPRTVASLWPGWLPEGQLSLLEVEPACCPLLPIIDLCARLSSGRPWPDGGTSPGPANALIIRAHGENEQLFRQQLEAAGADTGRVYPWPYGDRPRLPDGFQVLGEVMSATQARLVVIEPPSALLGPNLLGADEWALNRTVDAVARLAQVHRAALLLVSGRARPRTAAARAGSKIAGLCAMHWLAALDPSEPAQTVLAQVKNLGPRQPSLSYAVRPVESSEVLEWRGLSKWTAERLLARRQHNARSSARAFLAAFLAAGPQPAAAVWQAAKARGLSVRTVNRAKGDLGVRSEPGNQEGRPTFFWVLAEQRLPERQNSDREIAQVNSIRTGQSLPRPL